MMAFAPWTGARPRRDDARTLAQRVAAGDAAALSDLYRSEAGPVYRYVLALCANPGWAADATQDAFVAFAERPGDYDASRGTPGAYLAGMARHALLAMLRRTRMEAPLPEEDSGEEGRGPGLHEQVHPESLQVRAQDSAALWVALRQLPWGFREAVVLVDLQERPYAEAARIAGVELNTLRTRLHRGRARLAAALNAAPGESP